MAIKGNFRMGGMDYSTPSLNNNRDYGMSFQREPAVDVPSIFSVPSLPAVTNEMSSNRQPGLNISNDMLQEDMMKEVVKTQLQDLQKNKDILQNIDAGDGSGRNLYQTEIQDIITKSPLHQEAYIEEYPVGGTFNTAVPDIMEAAVKASVPGLGIGSEILNSFNVDPKINNDNFSIEDKGYGSLGEELFGNRDLPGIYNQPIEKINKGYDSLGQQIFIQNLKDNPDIFGPSIEDITNINISDYLGGDFGSGGTQVIDVPDTTDTITTKADPREANTVMASPYSSGLDYAMSIADGSNVANMIAPSMSYSAANPEGFTQADINDGIVSNPFPPIGPATVRSATPDDPYYLDKGIGGVNIPVDRHDDPPRDIFGAFGGAGNPNLHISHTGLDEQIASGYQPLNMSGIQKILDNLG